MTIGRVLIVDDEPDICELVAEVAEMAGFAARMLTGSRGFRSALAEFKPQAIVLDLLMPGMDGVELMRELAATASRARLVLISGQDERVLNAARELGTAHGLHVEATLEKPLNIKALRAALDAIARA